MTRVTEPPWSSAGRRVHLAVEGDSIVETLQLLRESHARIDVIHAIGRIDGVRLDGEPRTGAYLVVSLSGHVSAERPALTLVARSAEGALIGGVLNDARAIELELSVELLDPPIAGAESSEAKQPLRSAKTLTWQEVAAASAEKVEEEDPVESPLSKLGDIVEHATFGTCSVTKVEDDDDFILVRTPTNRLLRLSLDVLRLVLVSTDENGKQTFRARGKAK